MFWTASQTLQSPTEAVVKLTTPRLLRPHAISARSMTRPRAGACDFHDVGSKEWFLRRELSRNFAPELSKKAPPLDVTEAELPVALLDRLTPICSTSRFDLRTQPGYPVRVAVYRRGIPRRLRELNGPLPLARCRRALGG